MSAQNMLRSDITLYLYILVFTSKIMRRIKSFFDKNKTWLRNIGLAGFLFFLLKGIAWLILGFVLFK